MIIAGAKGAEVLSGWWLHMKPSVYPIQEELRVLGSV